MRILRCLALSLMVCVTAAAQSFAPIDKGVVAVSMKSAGQSAFKVLLNQNVTKFSFAGTPQFPMLASVIFTQDSFGGRTVTGFASNITNTCLISSVPNATTVCLYQFDPSSNSWFSAGNGR